MWAHPGGTHVPLAQVATHLLRGLRPTATVSGTQSNPPAGKAQAGPKPVPPQSPLVGTQMAHQLGK